MKLAIVGSRDYKDYNKLKEVIHQYFTTLSGFSFDEIISGGCAGVDTMAAKFAKEHGIKLKEYLPDWTKYGAKAAPIRNEEIIKASDTVLAFWCHDSRGTRSSISIAKRLKKTTLIIYPD